MNLVYTVPTWELPVGSPGCCGNHHLRDLVESISVNVGELTWNAKESEIEGGEIPPEILRCPCQQSAWP
jgi:hypothetical protein